MKLKLEVIEKHMLAALPGKIIQINEKSWYKLLIPLFLLDEIDKMGQDFTEVTQHLRC